MGGAIGFTLREENGKEHRMCRWTNMMPWAVDHIGIALKDPIHVHDVVRGWYEMLEDYKKGRKQKSPMAWCYCPYAGLRPVEYGLVVVDLQQNWILDMNDYHRMGQMSGVCLVNELEATSITGSATTLGAGKKLGTKAFKTPDDIDNDCKRFLDFHKAGRVKYALDPGFSTRPIELPHFKTLGEMAKYIRLKDHR